MSKREDKAVLLDIFHAMERIILYTSKLEYSDFLSDIKTQDAVIRNIEILGEAAKLLSDEMKNELPDIPWKDISGTRDVLIHDYFGVNLDIVWNIARNEIPLIYNILKDFIK